MKIETSRSNQTLSLIKEKLELDQGKLYNKLLQKELAKYNASKCQINGNRNYLGASSIGAKCARKIWYSYNNSKTTTFNASQVLLLNRGHLEECRFLALLKMINIEVNTNPNHLSFFALQGKFGGHLDGIGIGFLEYPKKQIVCEFKTHNQNSFNQLEKKGVELSKFEHFVQVQMYMGGKGLEMSAYFAVNKNTDSLYIEFIEFRKEVYQYYLQRAELILNSKGSPPPKINESKGWYLCKMCQYNEICH